MDNDWKWYYPSLSRIDAEHLLEGKKSGTYLVRKSESSQSDFVLSLSSGTIIFHYRIKCSSKGLFLDAADGVPQLYFSSCNELIQYYKKPDCGLPYILGSYVTFVDSAKQKASEDSDLSDDETELDEISPFFKQQFSVITSGKSDEVLQKLIKEYVEKGVNIDWQKVHCGATEPPFLQQLLARAGADLQSSLDVYLKRLEVIKELFAFGSDDYLEKLQEDEDVAVSNENEMMEKQLVDGPKDLESILKMLNMCQTSIFKLEQKACKVLKETGGVPGDKKGGKKSKVQVGYSSLPQRTPSSPSVGVSRGEHMFEVTSGTLKNKSILMLHVRDGKFFILKSKHDDLESSTCYSCGQVLQLVKSKSYKTKLNIVLENQVTKQYSFENYKSRELFCQRMQQMKIAHSTDVPCSELSVFIGTWNMGDTPPPADTSEWYKCLGLGKTKAESFSLIPSDIFAFGTQESAYHEKEWVSRVKTDLERLFDHQFDLVSSCSLWGIRLIIFVKSGLMKLVNSVKQSTVRTGIANTLGNKGAVGISFNIGATSFCFVNCHLTSGSEKLSRRNQNYHTILRGLDLGQKSTFGITNSFHHLFWFGDLNYRIDLEVTEIIKYIMENNWASLMASDQLNNEIKNKNAFIQLEEEDLKFCPTYRYKRGTRAMYIWTKEKITGDRINVPSWCDRVLWKSYPCLTSINTSYGCPLSIDTSDHSPVFASFDVGLLSETLSTLSNVDHSDGKEDLKRMKIILIECQAKVLSTCNTRFVLEFHSNCLEKTYTSRMNSLENYEKKLDSLHQGDRDQTKNYAYPWWVQKDLLELVPIIFDPNYLKDQHLLIAVKGNDDQESYGECVISIQPLLSGMKQSIELPLSHLGMETGLLKLVVRLSMPEESTYMSSNKAKIYELISVADEDANSNRGTSQSSAIDDSERETESSILSSAETTAPQSKPRTKKKEKIAKQFYTWLKGIRYEKYYDILVDNGYDDLDYFCSITATDLEEIGINNEQDRYEIAKSAKNIQVPKRTLTSV